MVRQRLSIGTPIVYAGRGRRPTSLASKIYNKLGEDYKNLLVTPQIFTKFKESLRPSKIIDENEKIRIRCATPDHDQPSSISVELGDNKQTLVVRTERGDKKSGVFTFMERQIYLPGKINLQGDAQIEGKYDDGYIDLTIPRSLIVEHTKAPVEGTFVPVNWTGFSSSTNPPHR